MRRLFLWLTLLGLLAGTLTARGEAAPFAARSQCLHQGRLLALDGAGVAAWDDAGQAWAREAALPEGANLSWLLSGGDQLYALDAQARALYPLSLAGGQVRLGEAVALRGDLLDDPEEQGTVPSALVLLRGRLYAFYEPQSAGGWSGLVVAYDTASGDSLQLPLPYPQAIAAYEEGQLLVLSLNKRAADNTADVSDDYPELLAYSPDSGALRSLGRLANPFEHGPQAMVWDSASRSLLYTHGQKLYLRREDGSEALCAYVPGLCVFAGQGALILPLPGGRAALMEQGGISIRDTRPLPDSFRPLGIYGMRDLSVHQRALAGLDSQAVTLVDRQWEDPGRLGQLLSAGAGEIDVLFLDSASEEIARMVDKGYLMDLSGSPEIAAHIRRCYPMVSAPGQRGEASYLMPVAMDARILTARPALFARTGKAIPATFAQLCSLVNDWAGGDTARYPDMLPLQAGQPRQELHSLALEMGILQGDGGYDNGLMRALLASASALNTGPLEFPERDYSFMGRQALVGLTNYSLANITVSGQFGPEEACQPLMLAAQEGTRPVLPISVQYLAVYAATPDSGAALAYLEAYLRNLSHESLVMLYPDFDEPLVLEGMKAVLARYEGEIATLEKRLAEAEGANKTELEGELLRRRQAMQEQAAMRYHLSPEAIAMHRALMENARVVDRSLSMGWTQPDIRQLLKRLSEGQIGIDRFISEAEGRMRLMRLEDQ